MSLRTPVLALLASLLFTGCPKPVLCEEEGGDTDGDGVCENVDPCEGLTNEDIARYRLPRCIKRSELGARVKVDTAVVVRRAKKKKIVARIKLKLTSNFFIEKRCFFVSLFNVIV